MSREAIHVHLAFSKRRLRRLLALALAAGLVYAVRSETIRQSTIYPAPVGSYKKLVTTRDAILARDGGGVGIGTVSPPSGLQVAGDVSVVGVVSAGGGVFTGPMALQNNKAIRGAPPEDPQDAVTKKFVDDAIAAAQPKAAPPPPPSGPTYYWRRFLDCIGKTETTPICSPIPQAGAPCNLGVADCIEAPPTFNANCAAAVPPIFAGSSFKWRCP